MTFFVFFELMHTFSRTLGYTMTVNLKDGYPMHAVKILQGSVVTQTMSGGLTIHTLVADFL